VNDLTKYKDMSSEVSAGRRQSRPAHKQEMNKGYKALPGKENKQSARKKFL